MEASSAVQEYTYSIRQALGIANMRKAMNQDAQTVTTLISDMQDTSAKVMEASVTPYKGASIDVRV